MLGLEKDQKDLMVTQISQMLNIIVKADIQFQVLIGAGNVTYSSLGSNNLDASKYTLDCVRGWGAWVPQTGANQWIKLSFQNPKQFIGVVIQGQAVDDQWVKTFEVQYSNDGVKWIKVSPLLNVLQATDTYQQYTFYGNNDRNTKVTNYFKKPVTARAIRILPLKFQKSPCLRFDFLTKK